MNYQSFSSVRRVIFGAGSIQSIGEEIKRLQANKVLVVTDPGIKSAGILDHLLTALDKAKIQFRVFSEVEPEPRIEVVADSIGAAGDFNPELVIGLGGGSALDISKATAIMLTNRGDIRNYFGMEMVPNPGLPLILIPTTAGTGSEMTSISVLADTENSIKKGIVSEHMYARVALLDPELTLGLPRHVTAATGMDAFVHALESYTGLRASFLTDTLNLEAIHMIAGNLRRAYVNGNDIKARTQMLQASAMAGIAFSNTQNGLDHAIALAIGGRFHLPHGLLTAFICPWVVEYNAMACPEKFIKVARVFGEDVQGLSEMEAARRTVGAIKSLLDDLSISYRLGDYDIPKDAIPDLARETMLATRLIENNPRQVNEQDVINLLEENY